MDLREQIDAYIEKYKFEIVSRTCDLLRSQREHQR